jgi:hypothetical protein
MSQLRWSVPSENELLAWIIRTAAPSGPDRVPVADQDGPQADQPGTSVPGEIGQGREPGPEDWPGHRTSPVPVVRGGPQPVVRALADQVPEPGWTGPEQAGETDQVGGPDRAADHADQGQAVPVPGSIPSLVGDANAAAVIAYRDSLRAGSPLSERKLAELFGLTSRRWARNRMAEARQSLAAA